jgi:hypothetical protein
VLVPVLAALCSGGFALAAPQPAAPAPAAPAPRDCGPGHKRVHVGGPTVPYLCVHAADDTYAALGVDHGRARGAAVPAAKPTCYGDGQTGSRIQLIYGYAQGYPNRAKVAVPQIRDVIAPRMEAIIRAGSAGKDLGLRFQMTAGCKAVDVKTIAFPRAAQETPNRGAAIEQYVAVSRHLDDSGLNRDDRKYVVFWDGWTTQGVCGIATTMLGPTPVSDSPQQVNPHEGAPTVGGHTDVGTAVGVGGISPKYAMVWGQVLRRGGPSCWGGGRGQRPTTAIHELFHVLGAVQASAPHSDGKGHCLDGPSIMCYGDKNFYIAACDQPVPVIDCGQDDYWHPNPAPGTHLDTHANVARSRFLGPQPQDALVGLPVADPAT